MANNQPPTSDMASTVASLATAIADIQSGQSHDGSLSAQLEWEELKLPVREKALRLLDVRPRSVAEVRDRLDRAEFPHALIEEVIEDLTRVGLLDDERFATLWVKQRFAVKKKSIRALDDELRHKGVDAETRQAALAQLSSDEQEETVRTLCEKKARTVKTLPESWADKQKMLAKIVGFPARKGFPQSLCMQYGRQALESRIAELRLELGDGEGT